MLSIASKLTNMEAASALEGLVSLGVRLMIASSTRSGSVEQPLARVGNIVYTGQATTAKEIFKLLSNIVPSDEQFRSSFETATISKARLARYLLRTLEQAHTSEAEPWFIPNEDPHLITLEHVLPLKPMRNWPEITDDIVKIYSKRIGNLVLLQAKSNSDLGSASFAKKAPILAESPYKTTSMIGHIGAWGPSHIEDRQRTLAQLALSAWPNPAG